MKIHSNPLSFCRLKKKQIMTDLRKLVPVVRLVRLNLDTSGNERVYNESEDPYETDSDSDYQPINEQSDSDEELPSNFFETYEITTTESHNSAHRKQGTERSKRIAKKHACLYCSRLLTNMPRHIQRQHSKETLVKEMLNVAKGSEERRLILDKIRKEGDRKHNQNEGTDNPIKVRDSDKSDTAYAPCPVCFGYYSVKNLCDHVREYHRDRENAKKFILGRSRVLSISVHPEASTILREVMYPSLRNFKVLRLAATDDTVVRYANSLVNKYYRVNNHQCGMVTTFFRFIARLFHCFQEFVPNAKKVKEMIDPAMYDDVVRTINKVAGLRQDGRFEAPSNATNACTLLAKIGHFLQCKAIEEQNQVERQKFKDFLYLLQMRQNSDITKMALESRTAFQRRKVEELPTTRQIKELITKIEIEVNKAYCILKEGFSAVVWTKLMQYVLTSIVVFNRRRPGDVEKAELVEYRTMINLHEDQRTNLSEIEKRRADRFYRFRARGKLNKLASVLISKENKLALDLLIMYRKLAKIPETNKYLFSNPGKGGLYFKADKSLKMFCREHNFAEHLFTATKLRKHLATCTSTLPQKDQEEISYFMGHSIKVHNNIYVQRLVESDILHMGHILTEAAGFTEELHPPNKEAIINATPEWLDDSTDSSCDMVEVCKTKAAASQLSTIYENNENASDISSDMTQCQDTNENLLESNIDMAAAVKPKRICEPHLRRHKRTWETPEREILRRAFQPFLREGVQPPTLSKCQDIILEKKIKLDRTLPQIHSWVVAEKKRTVGSNKKRKGWSTPEKQACRDYFKVFYENISVRQYPTTDELKQAVAVVPELKGKTVPILRSHLQHDFEYMEKRRSI